jgi:hypothetical protein
MSVDQSGDFEGEIPLHNFRYFRAAKGPLGEKNVDLGFKASCFTHVQEKGSVSVVGNPLFGAQKCHVGEDYNFVEATQGTGGAPDFSHESESRGAARSGGRGARGKTGRGGAPRKLPWNQNHSNTAPARARKHDSPPVKH